MRAWGAGGLGGGFRRCGFPGDESSLKPAEAWEVLGGGGGNGQRGRKSLVLVWWARGGNTFILGKEAVVRIGTVCRSFGDAPAINTNRGDRERGDL